MGNRRDFSWTCLVAGGGGTGVSSMASVEDIALYSSERTVVERCLINAGDSTQRHCGENKIKLARVSCIIISSLAPHNISGLPGIILSLSGLGVGELTVAGPVGLKGLVQNISSFVNRKYPVINVIEVGSNGATEGIEINKAALNISLLPIFAKSRPGHSLAVAAVVRPKAPTVGAVACIPVASQFAMSPSISEVQKWIKSYGCTTATYVPMTVSRVTESTLYSIEESCETNELLGILVPENLDFAPSTEASEIEQTLQTISLTSFLAPALFPRISPALSVLNLLEEHSKNNDIASTEIDTSTRRTAQLRIEKLSFESCPSDDGQAAFITMPSRKGDLINAVPKLTIRYSAGIDAKDGYNTIASAAPLIEMKVILNKSISHGFDPASAMSAGEMIRYCTNSHLKHRIFRKTKWLLRKIQVMSASIESKEKVIVAQTSATKSLADLHSSLLCQEITQLKEAKEPSTDTLDPIILCSVHKGHMKDGIDLTMFFATNPSSEMEPNMVCAICDFLKVRFPHGNNNSSQYVPAPDPRDPIVSFLGTGCATPSKDRSNSAIFVQCFEGLFDPSRNQYVQHPWGILLDAGESVCYQIYQSCNCDSRRYNEALLSIRIVWISHHHADHQTGLIKLLQEINRVHSDPSIVTEAKYQYRWKGDVYNFLNPSQRCCKNDACRVVVIAPENVVQYAEYISCVSGFDEIVQFVDINRTKYSGIDSSWAWASGPLVPKYGNGFITSVPVEHCRNAFGICFNLWRPGTFEPVSPPQVALQNSYEVKIVFSGDCRPSLALVEAGQGCDLLIHEATFEDSMKEDALCKRHCTCSEALEIAAAMGARNVILTHFSQRYPKVISSNSMSAQYTNAIDFLRLAVPSQAQALPALMNVVAEILGAESEE